MRSGNVGEGAAGPRAGPGRGARGRRGSALVLALWTLFFLAALALAVGAQVSAQVELARRLSLDARSRGLARSAVEQAVMEVAADTNRWDAPIEPWRVSQAFRGAAPGEDGSYCVVNVSRAADGGAVTNFGLADEESKVNLNLARPELVQALFQTAGGLDAGRAADAAHAVADWVDADHEVLTGGAEDNYYATLAGPYDAHDGPFQAVCELGLVKGMDAGLFSRMADCVTIFGTGKVNVNTASAPVLKAVGMAAGGTAETAGSLAGKIAHFREAGNAFGAGGAAGDMVRALSDFVALTPPEADLLRRMGMHLGVYSTCFGGIAVGRAGAGRAGESRIEFVFHRDTRKALYWHEF